MLRKTCSRCGEIKHRSNFNQCLEQPDHLSHFCKACDNRRKSHYAHEVPWPPPTPLPGRETACPACLQEFRFDTDREGRCVRACACGRRYVALRAAPKVERKPVGKRI